MPTTDKQQATAAALAQRAERVSMLRNRAMAGVIATFVLALGTVGWSGAMGAQDSAASGTSAGLVDDPSSSATDDTSDDATSAWQEDPSSSSSSSADDGAALSTGQS